MIALDIGEVLARFPGFRVALVVAWDLSIPAELPPAGAEYLAYTEEELRRQLADAVLAELPEVRCWREAFKAMGVKKTSYRSSVERLLKAFQRGGALPRVSPLVDLYNAVSAAFRMPVGADDLDRVAPPLAFRYSRPGDSFVRLGDPARAPDPPKPGEVVYADAEKCLCRRWNWCQDARSAISPRTRRAVLTVQALEPGGARLEDAAAALSAVLAAHCGARCRWAVADRATPRAVVGADPES